MKPTKEAIVEYKNGDSNTKNALKNIFGADAFKEEEKRAIPEWQDKIDRLKLFSDILKEVGETEEAFAERTKGMAPDTIGYEKNKLITLAFNGDKKIDMKNSNQKKHFPVYDMDYSTGRFVFAFSLYRYTRTHSGLGSRLSLFSKERSDYMGKQFEPTYNRMFGSGRPKKK